MFETEVLQFIRTLTLESLVLALSFFRMFDFGHLMSLLPHNSYFTIDFLSYVFEADKTAFHSDKAFSKMLAITLASDVGVLGFGYYELMLRVARQRFARAPNSADSNDILSIMDVWKELDKKVENKGLNAASVDKTDYVCWFLYLAQLTGIVLEGMSWGGSLEKSFVKTLSHDHFLTVAQIASFYEANKNVLQARQPLFIPGQSIPISEVIELVLRTFSRSFEDSNLVSVDAEGVALANGLHAEFLLNNRANGQLTNLFANPLEQKMGQVTQVRVFFYLWEDSQTNWSEELKTTINVTFLELINFVVDNFKIGEMSHIEYHEIPEEVLQVRNDSEVQKVLKNALQQETLFGQTLYLKLVVRKSQRKSKFLESITHSRNRAPFLTPL